MAGIVRTDREDSSCRPVEDGLVRGGRSTIVGFQMNEDVPIKFVRREGKGRLLEINGLPVLHLEGTPREMGLQHGSLMPERVKQGCQAYVHDHAIGANELALEQLLDIYAKAEPFIPDCYLEEMAGLSDAAGIELDLIHAFHVLPTLFHCSGCAAMNSATRDGKLYHYRSLDHSLEIGNAIKAQSNACITVWEQEGRIPVAGMGWIGAVGLVTGMNAAGMSMGEMGSHCEDETFEGRPMWFQMREMLSLCEDLNDGRRMIEEWPRDCGFNFILADGKVPDAIAIEVTHSMFEFFETGDSAEDVEPHYPIKDVVRRTNHFVSPRLSKTQRETYDPRSEKEDSAAHYACLSENIEHVHGKLDAEQMIWLCRCYPPDHSCLHQAVFCPADGDFWFANAASPDESETPGAQNQPFLPFNLNAILEFDAVEENRG